MAKRSTVLAQISSYPTPTPITGKKPSEMSQYELTVNWCLTKQDLYFSYLLKSYQRKIEKSANSFFEYLPVTTTLGMDVGDIYSDLLEKFQHAVLYSYLGILKGKNPPETFSLAGAVTYYFKSYYSNLKKKCKTCGREDVTYTQSLFRDVTNGEDDDQQIRYSVPKSATNFMFLDEKASEFVETLTIPEQTAFYRLRQGKITDTRCIKTRLLKKRFVEFQADWEARRQASKEKPEFYLSLDTWGISYKNKTDEEFFMKSLQHVHPTLPLAPDRLKGTNFARSRLSADCHGKGLKLLIHSGSNYRDYPISKLASYLGISDTSARRMRGKLGELIESVCPDLKFKRHTV